VLGFKNVASLKGGIINYSKQMEDINKQDSSGSSTANIVARTRPNEEENVIKLGADEFNGTPTKYDLSSAHVTRHIPESLFMGTNYVFDARMSSSVTQEAMSTCETCGTPCGVFSNCGNTHCHVRYIQCRDCSAKYNGCCCMVSYSLSGLVFSS
jgi:predicted sulfurtransferase